MIKIEATTLEEAYTNAATTLKCSVSQLKVEIVQVPRSGFLGMFKKSAIIVATVHTTSSKVEEEAPAQKEVVQEKKDQTKQKNLQVPETPQKEQSNTPRMLNDTIMPASFVSDQDDEDEDLKSGLEYTADYDDEFDEIMMMRHRRVKISKLLRVKSKKR
jgi:spoIIIJ-associated protein